MSLYTDKGSSTLKKTEWLVKGVVLGCAQLTTSASRTVRALHLLRLDQTLQNPGWGHKATMQDVTCRDLSILCIKVHTTFCILTKKTIPTYKTGVGIFPGWCYIPWSLNWDINICHWLLSTRKLQIIIMGNIREIWQKVGRLWSQKVKMTMNRIMNPL